MPFSLTPFQVSSLLIIAIYLVLFLILFGNKRFAIVAPVGALAFLIGQVAAERLLPEGPILLGNVRLLEASLLSWAAMVATRRLAK